MAAAKQSIKGLRIGVPTAFYVDDLDSKVNAIQGFIELGDHLIATDDGDGVITSAEIEAASPDFPNLQSQGETIQAFCSA